MNKQYTEEEAFELAEQCEKELSAVFKKIDNLAYANTKKVMDAFAANRLSDSHFAPSSGYGYDDRGREICDKLYADILGAEAAFARHSIVSGTHALTIALFALLRPGDTLYAVTGKPYDTLDSVIGITECAGSLAEYGVKYKQAEGFAELDEIKNELLTDKSIKVVFIQRSKGYDAYRPTLSVNEIGEICEAVKAISNAYVIVDNCYGEFCEENEPTSVGADLIVGSLIKNIGGGIAETGGYIAGTAKAVELAAARLTSPGIGLECGATLGQTKPMLKGLYFAPHVVGQALKAMALAALMFEKCGYTAAPGAFEDRYDIIQTIKLGSADKLCRFCEGIQAGSPVDSFVVPEPWAMPGYNDEVIMAAGAFTQGSSIELSADAPLREPYTVYVQGGLTYESAKLTLCRTLAYIASN